MGEGGPNPVFNYLAKKVNHPPLYGAKWLGYKGLDWGEMLMLTHKFVYNMVPPQKKCFLPKKKGSHRVRCHWLVKMLGKFSNVIYANAKENLTV